TISLTVIIYYVPGTAPRLFPGLWHSRAPSLNALRMRTKHLFGINDANGRKWSANPLSRANAKRAAVQTCSAKAPIEGITPTRASAGHAAARAGRQAPHQ